MPTSQHGFLPGRSTSTNLLFCMDDWTQSMDDKTPLDIAYIDFSKAFDLVQTLALNKLNHLGIRDRLLTWIRAFLTKRQFTVIVQQNHSAILDLPLGVVQGSVLGPLLFLLFVSDLPTSIKSSISTFADNTKIYNFASKAVILQKDLDLLEYGLVHAH